MHKIKSILSSLTTNNNSERDNIIEKKCIIDFDGIGERLDKYLACRFTYHSRTEWQNIISIGIVKINGKSCKVDKRLKKGDEIIYQIFNLEEPKVNSNITVIYEDEYILICSKPPDLPVIPRGKYHYNTLYHIMKERLKGNIHLINRLDRETSGCMMIAKSKESAAKFRNIMKKREIRKLYVVVVKAVVKDKSFVVEGNIGMVSHPFYKQMQGFTVDGKYSKTTFYRISQSEEYALLFALIETGRMHQIRAHLHSLGYYTVGDKIYGEGGPSIFKEFLEDDDPLKMVLKTGMGRQALHSYRIGFVHPITGKYINIKAPIPSDIRSFCEKKGLL